MVIKPKINHRHQLRNIDGDQGAQLDAIDNLCRERVKVEVQRDCQGEDGEGAYDLG